MKAARGRGAGAVEKAPRSTLKASSFGVDDALIGLLIGAMNANEHVAADEAARAHHIIWSMRRFRRKSGDTVGRTIDRMKTLIEEHGPWPVIETALRRVPARLRPAAFAVATDLVLVDGKMERLERQFLNRLARALGLDRNAAERIVAVMLVKNSA